MSDPFVGLPPLVPLQDAREPIHMDGNAQRGLASSVPSSSDLYLLTKVTVPPLRASILRRPPLFELLEIPVPLTLLSAGAGYGKTTLLAAWANMRRGHVAWLTLESLENDPLRFWAYVLLALRSSIPSLGEQASAWLEALNAVVLPHLLTELLNALASRDEALTLILDDYQVIEEPLIGQSLAFLLAHAPACLHLVLATRTDPLLPLARLRAHGQLTEIREAQLRLSTSEARQFLADTMGLQLAETDVEALWQRSEGWVAGLQLAALALHSHTDLSLQVHQISGSHRFLVEYVQEDILANMPEALQTFLLQTSVLSQMTASLCAAVTGEEASGAQLLALERANLFVVPLDAEFRWYRLHPLVREALLAHLRAHEPESLARSYRRAARWYAEQKLFPEAIAHALEASDFDLAADLIERSVVPQSWRNMYHTLRGFLSRLPQEVLHARPQLCLLAAQAFYMTTPIGLGEMPVVEAYLSRAVQGYRAAANQAGVGSVLALRSNLTAFQGHFSLAFAAAQEALSLLPEGDVQWRGHALGVLGVEALMEGSLERAQAFFQQALACHEASDLLGGRQFATLMRAEIHLIQGDRARAAQGFRQVVALATLHPDQASAQLTDTFGKRRAHFEYGAWYSLAALAYEENRLEEAQHALSTALVEGQFALVHVLTPGLLLQVRLLEAVGSGEQARTLLLELESTAREPGLAREIQLCQAWLVLARGDLVSAEAWTARLNCEVQPLSRARREEETELLARLRIAQHQPEEALLLLEPLLEEARRQKREFSVLQIQVLLSLTEQARGKGVQAKQRLFEAVTRASSQGYVRLFLEEGEAMDHLLRKLLPDLQDAVLAAYVRALLQAFAPVPEPHTRPDDTKVSRLLDPLTPQEQRVLALLAQGASNQQIAKALVIERSTVKSHVSHLLSKLRATTRTQAIARAREWSLL